MRGEAKKLKRMKKKLDELNRKIQHSKKKHDGMIHKRNALRKLIEGLKGHTSEDLRGFTSEGLTKGLEWDFKELNRAFRGVYRSYWIRGYPRMDAETFLQQIRGKLIALIRRELTVLRSSRTQVTMWARLVRDDGTLERVELAFNSEMAETRQGSDLDLIVDEMISQMLTQIENPALLNSRFRFDEVLFVDANFHRLNLMRRSSYLPLPDWLLRKKVLINPNNDDNERFK